METAVQQMGQAADALDNMFGGGENDGVLLKDIDSLAQFIAVEESEIKLVETGLKARKANLDQCKEQLATLMKQNGMESVKLDCGLTPKVKAEVKFYKASGVEDEQLHDWLRSHEMKDIIKPYVHFQTLQGALKDFEMREGVIPESLLTRSERSSVTMYNKSKFLANRKDTE